MVVGREETTTIWIRRKAGKSEPPASSSSFLAPLPSPPPLFHSTLSGRPFKRPPLPFSSVLPPPLLARFQFHGSSIQIGGFRRRGRGGRASFLLPSTTTRTRTTVGVSSSSSSFFLLAFFPPPFLPSGKKDGGEEGKRSSEEGTQPSGKMAGSPSHCSLLPPPPGIFLVDASLPLLSAPASGEIEEAFFSPPPSRLDDDAA